MSLRVSTLPNVDAAAATIRDGKNQMPGFSALLTDAQIAAVAAYVLELGGR